MLIANSKKIENELFIMSCVISMLVSFILIILDAFISNTNIPSVIGVICFIVFSFFYYQLRYRNRYELLRTPFIVVLLLIVNACWYFGGGLSLSNTYVFYLVLIITLIISPAHSRTFFIVVIFVNLMIFVALEFLYPANSQVILNSDERKVINSIALFMAFSITAYIILFFKNHYEKERELVRSQNLEMDASNSEIEAQNEELIQYQEEVMAQRDFIDEKNKILEHQAVKLEQANQENKAINSSLERAVAERTQKLSDLNNDLDLLVYRSSHDFRRPLTTLMGLYEIARLTVKDELSRELFSKVNSTAMSMDKMLLKFFMLYNINHFRTTYEGETLDEIIDKIENNLISRKRDITFDRKVKLQTYREKDVRNSLIEIILENLIENSLIYHNRNHIHISLEIIEEAGKLYIREQDNGMGIPKLYRDKVFDMYFRGSILSTGNGLGLYVVKRAANLLKASIKLESKEDVFTRVEIVFEI